MYVLDLKWEGLLRLRASKLGKLGSGDVLSLRVIIAKVTF
jgi:hypothetical protein